MLRQPLQTCFCVLFDSLLCPEHYHHSIIKLQPQDSPDKTYKTSYYQDLCEQHFNSTAALSCLRRDRPCVRVDFPMNDFISRLFKWSKLQKICILFSFIHSVWYSHPAEARAGIQAELMGWLDLGLCWSQSSTRVGPRNNKLYLKREGVFSGSAIKLFWWS